ncbi:MAG: hypothetical protein JW963_08950 [Anaerolineales bacterium]|nr:hypothetical protein [Anaerolineales bacterium]
MTIKTRVRKLEEKHSPKAPPVTLVYFHDQEKGYSKTARDGGYYPTLEALAAAQGWDMSKVNTTIKVTYK